MAKVWNTDKTTYYGEGKKPFKINDPLSEEVLKKMGKETVEEFTEKEWIADGKSQDEIDAENKQKMIDAKIAKEEALREALLEEAKKLGLKPHHNIGIKKLQDLIGDQKQFEALKTEATELDIEVTEDMDAADLQELVDLIKIGNTAKGLGIEVTDDMDFDAIKEAIDNKPLSK